MHKKTKVLILHNFMAPYRFPLFRKLSEYKDVDLTVHFMTRSQKNRRWKKLPKLGFKYKVLPRWEISLSGKDLLAYIINYTFPFEFLRSNFDVVISAGWLDFASQMGFILSKIMGRKFIIWSESTINEPSFLRKITLPFVKYVVKHSDACIAIGTKSKEYLVSLGASQEKIFVAYSTVDVEHFVKKSQMSKQELEIYKNKLGLSKSKVILYVGQFIERKGLKYLIEAFQKIEKKLKNVKLLLLGYGPQKVELESMVKRKKLTGVCFKDHVEIDEIPKYYKLADVFVLPSYEETWGLVINEAMSVGLPIVTTRVVGASTDLVIENKNGFVVKEKSSKDLFEKLTMLLQNQKVVESFSKYSRKHIMKFTPGKAAASFVKAIRFTQQ